MQDLQKVNGNQLFAIWKNFAVAVGILMATLLLSRFLPYYFSPIVGLCAAAVLYTILYNNKLRNSNNCMIVPYAMFYCVISYSFATIILNVLFIWNLVEIPKELSFFGDPFVASLLINPICFVTLVIVYMRRSQLAVCVDCRLSKGLSFERGKLGDILAQETRMQLLSLLCLFGVLSVIVWAYFYFAYVSAANINGRDWYVFLWLNIVACVIDVLYFASRYYNIYLDLKENGEIITEEELSDMTTKTYLRFYFIAGNNVFLNLKTADRDTPMKHVIDTPFITKRNVNGITASEVNGIIHKITGYDKGELRFIYGRRSPDLAKHRILRYAYYVKPGDPLPELDVQGEWIDFEMLKLIYNETPMSLGRNLLADLNRISTIVLTQKLYDENGVRKIKAKAYKPSYDLIEMYEKHYDFQDDKWIRISMFNSDSKGFALRRWWDRRFGDRKSNKKGEWEQRQ